MQRVAIARASVTSPSILFADEPTGNLDSASGDTVIDLLMDTRKNCTLVLVTHNPALAGLADREIRLRDGQVEQIVVHKKRSSKKAATKVARKATRKSGQTSTRKGKTSRKKASR